MARTVSQSRVEANLRKQVERLRARVIELQKELKPHSKGPRTYGSAMRQLQFTEHKLRLEKDHNKSLDRAYQHECDENRRLYHRVTALSDQLQEATARAEHNADGLIMANGEIDRLREAVTSISRLASVVGDPHRDGRPHGTDQPYPRRATNEKAMAPVGDEQPSAFLCTGDDVREEGF